jgi:hypothetical protein
MIVSQEAGHTRLLMISGYNRVGGKYTPLRTMEMDDTDSIRLRLYRLNDGVLLWKRDQNLDTDEEVFNVVTKVIKERISNKHSM